MFRRNETETKKIERKFFLNINICYDLYIHKNIKKKINMMINFDFNSHCIVISALGKIG
jgi:hypothetical protein